MSLKDKFKRAIVKINHFTAGAGAIGKKEGYRVLYPRIDTVDESENPTLYWILESAYLSEEIKFYTDNEESLNSMEQELLEDIRNKFKTATNNMFKCAKTANWAQVDTDWKIIKRNRKKGKDLSEHACEFIENAISDLKNKQVATLAKNTKTR